jgi:transitional endoplasmic reticulum ATPase
MSMDFYLRNFKQFKARGMKAYKEGDGKEARYCFLKASEYLFKLARGSTGAIRETRIENAKRMAEMAKKVEVGLKSRKPGTKKAVAKDEGDEGKGKFKVIERPKLKLADVAGLEDVKEEIRIKLIYPVAHPEKAKKFGIRPGGGILLYGPPGTGKTMIARAIAGEMEAAFFTVKPSEIMSKWVGEAEQNIAELFRTARNYPLSIIFIDEIEALVPKRRSSSSSVMQRVVPQILSEIEGFDSEGKNPILFLGATNEPWQLDPAVLRPGRFDEKVYVGLPDRDARRKILEINLKNRPVASDVDLDLLADLLDGFSGADIKNICEKAAADAFLEAIEEKREEPITLADLKRVITESAPSVDPGDLKKFQKYRKKVR